MDSRKTLTAEDLLAALRTLGLDQYHDVLRDYLTRHREVRVGMTATGLAAGPAGRPRATGPRDRPRPRPGPAGAQERTLREAQARRMTARFLARRSMLCDDPPRTSDRLPRQRCASEAATAMPARAPPHAHSQAGAAATLRAFRCASRWERAPPLTQAVAAPSTRCHRYPPGRAASPARGSRRHPSPRRPLRPCRTGQTGSASEAGPETRRPARS